MCIYTYKLYIHILKEIHQNILTGFNPLVLGFYFLSLFPSVPYHIIYMLMPTKKVLNFASLFSSSFPNLSW